MKGEFLKHYPSEWANATSALTLEQQGALMLFIGAQSLARTPLERNVRNLKRIFGCGNVKAEALLQALIAAKMIEVTQDGLSSPLIAAQLQDRDDVSRKRSAAGELGGRAKRKDDDSPVHHSGFTRASLEDHLEITHASLVHQSEVTGAVDAAKPLKLHDACEASASLEKSREEKRPPNKPPMGGDDEKRFAEFKAAYPKRNTAFPTTMARKRWLAQIRAGATPDAIIAGAKAYASEVSRNGKLGSEFVKTADSWLCQSRFLDFAPSPDTPATPIVTDDQWRDRVRLWRDRRGYWPYPTPHPNDVGTSVPRSILAEFGMHMPESTGPRSSSRLAA